MIPCREKGMNNKEKEEGMTNSTSTPVVLYQQPGKPTREEVVIEENDSMSGFLTRKLEDWGISSGGISMIPSLESFLGDEIDTRNNTKNDTRMENSSLPMKEGRMNPREEGRRKRRIQKKVDVKKKDRNPDLVAMITGEKSAARDYEASRDDYFPQRHWSAGAFGSLSGVGNTSSSSSTSSSSFNSSPNAVIHRTSGYKEDASDSSQDDGGTSDSDGGREYSQQPTHTTRERKRAMSSPCCVFIRSPGTVQELLDDEYDQKQGDSGGQAIQSRRALGLVGTPGQDGASELQRSTVLGQEDRAVTTLMRREEDGRGGGLVDACSLNLSSSLDSLGDGPASVKSSLVNFERPRESSKANARQDVGVLRPTTRAQTTVGRPQLYAGSDPMPYGSGLIHGDGDSDFIGGTIMGDHGTSLDASNNEANANANGAPDDEDAAADTVDGGE